MSLFDQVQQAYFGARFWIARARRDQAVTPIELLALMLEYHHHGDKSKAVADWYQALRAEISARSISARDADSLFPIVSLPVGDNWLVSVHDAELFLQSNGLGWSVAKAIEHVWAECYPAVQSATAQNAAPKAPESAPDAAEWKAAARTRASEIIKRQRQRDLYPSQLHIADQIAEEFRKAGTVGPGGKPLTGSYIKRHALTGISSAALKKLSTTTRRGN